MEIVLSLEFAEHAHTVTHILNCRGTACYNTDFPVYSRAAPRCSSVIQSSPLRRSSAQRSKTECCFSFVFMYSFDSQSPTSVHGSLSVSYIRRCTNNNTQSFGSKRGQQHCSMLSGSSNIKQCEALRQLRLGKKKPSDHFYIFSVLLSNCLANSSSVEQFAF